LKKMNWKVAVAGFAVVAIAVPALAAPAEADAALTLSQRVAKVEAKLACLQYAGLSEWSGYAAYYGGEYTAASFDVANGYSHSAGDYRVVVVKPTSTCRAKFPAASNLYSSFAARPAAVQEKVEKIKVG
jgi:hypothetical protein